MDDLNKALKRYNHLLGLDLYETLIYIDMIQNESTQHSWDLQKLLELIFEYY